MIGEGDGREKLPCGVGVEVAEVVGMALVEKEDPTGEGRGGAVRTVRVVAVSGAETGAGVAGPIRVLLF